MLWLLWTLCHFPEVMSAFLSVTSLLIFLVLKRDFFPISNEIQFSNTVLISMTTPFRREKRRNNFTSYELHLKSSCGRGFVWLGVVSPPATLGSAPHPPPQHWPSAQQHSCPEPILLLASLCYSLFDHRVVVIDVDVLLNRRTMSQKHLS